MTYHGHIKDGVVIFDEPVSLPEGASVVIQPISTQSISESSDSATLFERYQSVSSVQ